MPESDPLPVAAKPALLPGLSFGAYCDLKPHVNATTLLTYRGQSCAEARYEQLHPKDDTPSLIKGHASHAALLEPESYERDYAAMPSWGDCRIKVNKDKRDAWIEAHRNSIQLSTDEHEAAVNVRNSILKHPFASMLFTGPGQNEVTVTWTYEQAGLPCKARIDRLATYHGYRLILDLKTARDIDDRSIQQAIVNYGYHIRMAFYLSAMGLVAPSPNYRVALVWALNRPPWTCRATELESQELAEGRAQYRRLLALHAACVKADHWGGYHAKGAEDALDTPGLPPWAYTITNSDRG